MINNILVNIQAKVTEQLAFGSKKWFTLEFPNNSKITIQTKHCEVINDTQVKTLVSDTAINPR